MAAALTADETKVAESMTQRGTNNANFGISDLATFSGLDRVKTTAAVAGLHELGLIGKTTSPRGMVSYCKCGPLLAADK